jgi:formate-dependent nitrite reductase membrane component NrfD
MSAMATAKPIELIPPRQQALWGWPAVINFFLGGLGAGFYVTAALAGGFERSPAMAVASWLAPALVLAGFAAVAAEAGRPFRGPFVLLRARTSWMSRELWIGGAFVLLAVADMLFPLRLHRAQAAVAAVLLTVAQGFILRRARGIAAWDVAIMPALFAASALVSGAGLYLLVEVGTGRVPRAMLLGAVLLLLAADLVAWARYLTWSQEAAFVEAVRPLAEGRDLRIVVGAGHLAPFLLAALAAARPALAAPALALAGALMIAGQFRAKAHLILSAGRLRPITLAGLRIQRRSS